MNEIALEIADILIGADRPEKPFNTIEDQRDAIAALIERSAIDLWNQKNKEMAQELATLRIRCALANTQDEPAGNNALKNGRPSEKSAT